MINSAISLRYLKKFGIFDATERRAYWSVDDKFPNFGDMLTPYLIKKISGEKPIKCSKRCFRTYFTATGSILGWTNKNAIIWGTGIISMKDKIKKPKKILAVRGPITRKRLLELGYDCPEIYGDPALLLPKFYTPPTKKKYNLGIIPHYVDYERIKEEISSNEVLVINLLNPIEKVIDDINQCKRTISSSLHGIITSHAYGIPSVWTKFSNKLTGDGVKFKDYFLSVGIKPYHGFNFKDKLLEATEIIKLINSKKEALPKKIDTSKLWAVCPFRDTS